MIKSWSGHSKKIMFNRDRWQEYMKPFVRIAQDFLSGFTVALGIFIFIVLFGFGNGLKNTFKQFFLDDATNTLWVSPVRLLNLIEDSKLTEE